mmetsp:Transcript_252/g.359  ORF Transcript_252/g.359 Transcript_252/m.359 type:complete len:136 (-) Transcript_252:133-540(-)
MSFVGCGVQMDIWIVLFVVLQSPRSIRNCFIANVAHKFKLMFMVSHTFSLFLSLLFSIDSYHNHYLIHPFIHSYNTLHYSVMPKPTTALSAEWEKDWKETNFEADIKKLEKEAEERLDAKIEELKGNIASTGAEN